MAMGLVTVAGTEWFEIDALYRAEIAERHRLLAERRRGVRRRSRVSDHARAETLTMMVEHLTRVYPAWFARDGATIRNRLTGEQLGVRRAQIRSNWPDAWCRRICA